MRQGDARAEGGDREDDATTNLLGMASENAANAATVVISDAAAPEQAAKEAAQGKFIASVGALSKGARQAVQQTSDQGEVWKNVSLANASSGVKPDSGAFTHNYVDASAVLRLEPYIEALQSPVANTDQVVGVIVAINGKVDAADVFESTPLFRKLWPKLLKSYALDADNAVHFSAYAH